MVHYFTISNHYGVFRCFALFHGDLLAIHIVSLAAFFLVRNLHTPVIQFPFRILVWEMTFSLWHFYVLMSNGTCLGCFLKVVNTRILSVFSFLVLNAENQKRDIINVLDEREKRNHTLWIKLESLRVRIEQRSLQNIHKGLNTVKCTK